MEIDTRSITLQRYAICRVLTLIGDALSGKLLTTLVDDLLQLLDPDLGERR